MARRPGPALTRDDVLAAALAVVERDGPAGLGPNAVAARLGIKPPSLYAHVAGAAALRRAVAIEGWRRLGAAVAPPRRLPATRAGARRALAGMADRFRAFVHTHPALYAVMSATPLPPDDPDFRPVMEAVMAPFASALRPFGLAGSDAVHALRGLRAALHGFVSLELADQFGFREPTAETWRRIRATIVHGVEAAGHRRARRRR